MKWIKNILLTVHLIFNLIYIFFKYWSVAVCFEEVVIKHSIMFKNASNLQQCSSLPLLYSNISRKIYLWSLSKFLGNWWKYFYVFILWFLVIRARLLISCINSVWLPVDVYKLMNISLEKTGDVVAYLHKHMF